MMLRGWSWDAAIGPAGLGDRPLLAALAAARPDEAGEAAIAATGPRARRRRRLPTHLVVTLVVARGLWAAASLRQGLAAVVAGRSRAWPDDRATTEHRRHRPGSAAGRSTAAPGAVRGGGPADRHGADRWRLPGWAAGDGDRRHPDRRGGPAGERPGLGAPADHAWGRRVPPAPGARPDRDRPPRDRRGGDPPLRHGRGADRPAAAARGRPGQAAGVGSGLPLG